MMWFLNLFPGWKGPDMYDKIVWSQHCRAAAHTIYRRLLTLLLLVLGILANNHHMTFALDNLALFANGFN